MPRPTTRWLEISTSVDNEAVEAVAETFQRFAHGGVVIEYPTDGGPEVAWNEAAVIATDRPILVRGYLPRGRDGTRRRRQLEEALWHLNSIWPIPPPAVREVREEDWANAWKDHFFAHRVGEHFIIKPTWRTFEAGPGDLTITLDPGMAFGTGLHPTTRLCLLLIERYVTGGERILDVGTGSGILAIAAARRGATVLAADVDPIAVETARANVEANDLTSAIEVRAGSVEAAPAGATYDLVVANIIAGVIIDLAAGLAARVRPGGHLIVSGILEPRIDEVAAALSAVGLERVEVLDESDWRALVLHRLGT